MTFPPPFWNRVLWSYLKGSEFKCQKNSSAMYKKDNQQGPTV